MTARRTPATPHLSRVGSADLASDQAEQVLPQTSDIRPVSRGRVAERVVDEIRSYIEANDLRPGDKLPPERVFIERLGVSRSSLREALRVLSTVGLVDVRHGDGMYVGAPAESGTASPTAIFDATEQHALRNLVETRLGIELAAATAATQRASDEDLDSLEQLINEQAQQLHDNPGQAWEPLVFELALIELTGNSWLYEVEVMLRDAWLSLSGGLRASVGRHGEWLSEHHAILASMRSRNVLQVQRLVIAHLSLERFEEDLHSPNRGTSRGPKAGRKGRERTRR